jgi:hypothetical protein
MVVGPKKVLFMVRAPLGQGLLSLTILYGRLVPDSGVQDGLTIIDLLRS